MEQLGFWSARSLASAVKSKQLSPLEVLDACLARADEVDPKLNALVWRNDDEARSAAKAAGEAVLRERPEDLPPFHGVPMPVKDLTPVAGWPITYGSWGAPEGTSGESELVVEALQRAGFLLTGRTNVPELGPLPVSENLRYGVTRNPWDLSLSAGGSSGGAGAVVAAGVFPVAHANDGGGSVRIPASCCGLVGFKASRGRVPARAYAWEGAVVHGALTRDVADAAALLDVVSGPDPGVWYNAPAPERPFLCEVGADPGRRRVGIVLEAPFGLPVSPVCAEAAVVAGRALEALGHVVEPTSLDLTEEFVNAFLSVANADLGDLDGIIDWEKTEPHIRAYRAAAMAVNSPTYARSVHALQRLTRTMVAAWGRDFDVLLTPTMPVEPPVAGEVLRAVHASAAGGGPSFEVLHMTVMTAGFNVTGQPAVSLPAHVSPTGVPIGVQLVGGPFSEALLFRVAAQLEAALPWAGRRPSL
jgi:amidase